MLTQSVSTGVKFDLLNNGTSVNTGWVAPGDGLLVLPRGSDGKISSGAELFGSSTKMADGSLAANGYAALAQYDSNKDGQISGADDIFSELRVWVNDGPAGTADQGRLLSMSQLGITSLNLHTSDKVTQDNGNVIGLQSSYTTESGATHELGDAWFISSASDATTPAIDLKLPASTEMLAAATPASTAQVAALSTAELNALKPKQFEATGDAASGDGTIRGRVSRLTQAIGSFSLAAAGESTNSAAGTSAKGDAEKVAQTPATLAVSKLVGAMKRFDATTAAPAEHVPSRIAAALDTHVVQQQDPNRNALLASSVGRSAGFKPV